MLDGESEKAKGDSKIGSTLKGIGPTYGNKVGRDGILMDYVLKDSFLEKYQILKDNNLKILSKIYNANLNGLAEKEQEFFDAIDFLKEYNICDTVELINSELTSGVNILAEGAQGTLLDIDHGSYPFVTSSSVVAGGVCAGLGISPRYVDKIYGAAKAYVTRVGGGPFPTYLEDETGKLMQERGEEVGSTTGRARKCGWLDLVLLKYSCVVNGVTDLILLKADVLDTLEKIKVCTSYKIISTEKTVNWPPQDLYDVIPNYVEVDGWNQSIRDCRKKDDLPENFLKYIEMIEDFCGVPVSIISVGPDREQTIIVD